MRHIKKSEQLKTALVVFSAVCVWICSFSLSYAAVHHHHHKVTPRTVTTTTTTVTLQNKNQANLTHKKRLVELVTKTVNNLSYSKYKMGGSKFDTSKGIYIVDCSRFVDHLLESVNPHAYNSLVNATGNDAPNTLSYYNFFNGLVDDPSHYWNKIEGVNELQAGDILVFRKKNSEAPGHIMVVMKTPVKKADSFSVQVADSAPVGHSRDTRLPHVSGIGVGTLMLKVNPHTGHPYAYAWREGSYFKQNVRFAMARPIDIHS